MKGYQICYEYEKSGVLKKVFDCTVFNDYNKADAELCDVLSDLERKGCTNVAGEVVELQGE